MCFYVMGGKTAYSFVMLAKDFVLLYVYVVLPFFVIGRALGIKKSVCTVAKGVVHAAMATAYMSLRFLKKHHFLNFWTEASYEWLHHTVRFYVWGRTHLWLIGCLTKKKGKQILNGLDHVLFAAVVSVLFLRSGPMVRPQTIELELEACQSEMHDLTQLKALCPDAQDRLNLLGQKIRSLKAKIVQQEVIQRRHMHEVMLPLEAWTYLQGPTPQS